MNMKIREGLCNGKWLKVISIKKYLPYVEVILGACAEIQVFLPRIEFKQSEEELPRSFWRWQLAVRVGYVVSINKGQGQSLYSVSMQLNIPLFNHNQFSLATSRAKKRILVKIIRRKETT